LTQVSRRRGEKKRSTDDGLRNRGRVNETEKITNRDATW